MAAAVGVAVVLAVIVAVAVALAVAVGFICLSASIFSDLLHVGFTHNFTSHYNNMTAP